MGVMMNGMIEDSCAMIDVIQTIDVTRSTEAMIAADLLNNNNKIEMFVFVLIARNFGLDYAKQKR